MPLQRGKQDGAVLFGKPSAAHHDAIQTAKPRLMMPKTFTSDPLDSVARHGGFGNLAGNGQTESGVAESVGTSKHGEMAVAGFDRLGEDTGKGVPASQPGAARKARAIGHGVRASAGRGPWRGAL